MTDVDGVGVRPHVVLARPEVTLNPNPFQAGFFEHLTEHGSIGQLPGSHGSGRDLEPGLIKAGIVRV